VFHRARGMFKGVLLVRGSNLATRRVGETTQSTRKISVRPLLGDREILFAVDFRLEGPRSRQELGSKDELVHEQWMLNAFRISISNYWLTLTTN
jgi:hypothetical protein